VKSELVVSAVVSAIAHGSVAAIACHPPWDWRHVQPTLEPHPRDKVVETPADAVDVPALEASPGFTSSFSSPVPTHADHAVVQSAQRSAARAPTAPVHAPASPALRGRTRAPAPHLAASLAGRESAADLSDIFQGDPNAADALLYGEGSPRRDLSAPAMLGGAVYWDCPWPSVADRAGIDSAVVKIIVDVNTAGEPTSARLVRNAPYDFGEYAVECAMEHRYRPGTDSLGRPIASRTRPFPVIFSRTKKTAAR